MPPVRTTGPTGRSRAGPAHSPAISANPRASSAKYRASSARKQARRIAERENKRQNSWNMIARHHRALVGKAQSLTNTMGEATNLLAWGRPQRRLCAVYNHAERRPLAEERQELRSRLWSLIEKLVCIAVARYGVKDEFENGSRTKLDTDYYREWYNREAVPYLGIPLGKVTNNLFADLNTIIVETIHRHEMRYCRLKDWSDEMFADNDQRNEAHLHALYRSIDVFESFIAHGRRELATANENAQWFGSLQEACRAGAA